jgi:hypothetical protein
MGKSAGKKSRYDLVFVWIWIPRPRAKALEKDPRQSSHFWKENSDRNHQEE